MWEDTIVAEVHRTREELAAAFDFDVKAIFADIRKRQAALGARLVLQSSRLHLSSPPLDPVVPVLDQAAV